MPRQKGTFWEEFEKVVENGKERWKCKKCNNSWVKNESRMQQHYKICVLDEATISTYQPINSLCITKEMQEELESLFARGIYSSGISFNITENCDIKAFFAKACPFFKLPTRQSLSNIHLFKEYNDMNIVIGQLLNEIQYFCLITDGWSNIRRDSIINYMIATPKPFFYKSVHTKENQHTAINIAEGIETIMHELDINKFVA
ncbi:41218_t:CDS:1, partial [Gigaspora margarita]